MDGNFTLKMSFLLRKSCAILKSTFHIKFHSILF